MEQKWLYAIGVFCLCLAVVTICVMILAYASNEDVEEEIESTKTSTSTSTSTSPKKVCYDTNLKIDLDKDCESEYEKLVCPNILCRPEETNRMCYCLINPSELITLPFVGKTYVLRDRKITFMSNGEVLGQDNQDNNCFKSFLAKITVVSGNTRYVFDQGYAENGLVFIYDPIDGNHKVASELTGYTPRTDCVNAIRWA